MEDIMFWLKIVGQIFEAVGKALQYIGG